MANSKSARLISIPGFYEKLTTTLPGMFEHRCSVGKRGGFFERVQEGTWMGHVLEHTSIELQNLAGQDVGYGKARSARDEHDEIIYAHYHVVYEYEQEDVGLAAGKLAKRLLESSIWPERDPDFDFKTELEELIRLAERLAYGPSTRALVEEAKGRDIPVQRLDRSTLPRPTRPWRLPAAYLGHRHLQGEQHRGRSPPPTRS